MNSGHYSPSEDNVALNANYQGINPNLDIDKQKETMYPAIDDVQNATIKDDFIYLSTTDRQHLCYEAGELAVRENHTGFSQVMPGPDTTLAIKELGSLLREIQQTGSYTEM